MKGFLTRNPIYSGPETRPGHKNRTGPKPFPPGPTRASCFFLILFSAHPLVTAAPLLAVIFIPFARFFGFASLASHFSRAFSSS